MEGVEVEPISADQGAALAVTEEGSPVTQLTQNRDLAVKGSDTEL